MTLRWFPDGLPESWLAWSREELLAALDGPTLVRWPGDGTDAPRVVATLLHGDEPAGLDAMLHILRRRRRYPFDLYLIIGNVAAARAGVRYLDTQPDFNRLWGRGGVEGPLAEAAAHILDELRRAGVGAVVDVHNNSGDGPFYAIVTRLDADAVRLGATLSTTLLHWEFRAYTLMEALADHCPTAAVECGRADHPTSTAFAVDALRRYLGRWPDAPGDVDLYGRMHRVEVPAEVSVSFTGGDADLVVTVRPGEVNFRQLPPGTPLGWVAADTDPPLRVTDAAGHDVTAAWLEVRGGALVLSRPAVPVMLAGSETAARKDCLVYLCEPLSWGARSPTGR